jgi:uncharacterized repeat protein (TIGR01451 family)
VLNLTLDEGTGQVVVDTSGYNNNGTLGPTTGADTDDPSWVNGVSNSALGFDGIDDYVNITGNDGLIFYDDDSFSMRAWIKCPNGSTTQYTIVGEYDAGGRPMVEMQLEEHGYFRAYLYDGTNRIDYWIENPLDDNEWHCVGFTYDGGGGQILKLYIDGVEQQTVYKHHDGTLSGVLNGQDSFNIGKSDTRGGGDFFKGIIDEVCIWNRALTAQEIEENYWDIAPDRISINSYSISVSNPNPTIGETITITATVVNPTNDDVELDVKFWDRDPRMPGPFVKYD